MKRARLVAASLLFAAFSLTSCFTAQAEVLTFGIVGDAGMRNDYAPLVRRSLVSRYVTHLILPGDNLYEPETSYDTVWRPWRDAGMTFDVVAHGNHHGGYAAEQAYFGMPAENFTKSFGNDVLFVVLNSDNPETAAAQTAWFDREMSAATARFVFVVYHHPSYTVSERHAWTEKRPFQEAMRPLLWRYKQKITAVLAGHDHIASLIDLEGMPLIISGAATEQIATRPRDYTAEDGHRVKTTWLAPNDPYWVRLDVDLTLNRVWINFVRTQPEGVQCSIRIAPTPYEIRDNCRQ